MFFERDQDRCRHVWENFSKFFIGQDKDCVDRSQCHCVADHICIYIRATLKYTVETYIVTLNDEILQ